MRRQWNFRQIGAGCIPIKFLSGQSLMRSLPPDLDNLLPSAIQLEASIVIAILKPCSFLGVFLFKVFQHKIFYLYDNHAIFTGWAEHKYGSYLGNMAIQLPKLFQFSCAITTIMEHLSGNCTLRVNSISEFFTFISTT